MSVNEWVVLVLAGLGAGVLNTVAGSGSVFTLSALLWIGLPPTVANGTNRLGVLGQSFTAGLAYIRSGAFNLKAHSLHLVVAAIGATGGAYLASLQRESTFEWVIVATMTFMFALLFKKSKVKTNDKVGNVPKEWLAFVLLGIIGFYGGFIQMGMGVIALISLVDLVGYDYHRANGLKLLMTLFFSIPVLLVYIYQGQFQWQAASAILVGQVIGAALSTRFLIKRASFNRPMKVLLGMVILVTLARLILF